eukprot:2531023-Ditylum_brightwellii.AAC.1
MNNRKKLQLSFNDADIKKCGITFENLEKYVNHCKKKFPFLWSKCKHKRRNRKVNKLVSIIDLVENFIKPQTKGTGSSIALNMINANTAQTAE